MADAAAFEEIAVGHDDVRDLAFLNRPRAIGGAGKAGRIERQRAQRGVSGQAAFLDRPRRVTHKVCRLTDARRERKRNVGLLQRGRNLRRVGLCFELR